MNNEKEIKRIEDIICNCRGIVGYEEDFYRLSCALVNAGYGNIKQAVKEFAEKLKVQFENYAELSIKQSCSIINNLMTELYGENKDD